MGLCLLCGDYSWSCTYSNLQEYRMIVIRACLDWIKNVNLSKPSWMIAPYQIDPELQADEKEQLIPFLESLMKEGRINYSVFNNNLPSSICYFGLVGLIPFVNHSDCDGYYSPGDILNIRELFSRIFDFIPESSNKENLKELIKILEYSSEQKMYIIFC